MTDDRADKLRSLSIERDDERGRSDGRSGGMAAPMVAGLVALALMVGIGVAWLLLGRPQDATASQSASSAVTAAVSAPAASTTGTSSGASAAAPAVPVARASGRLVASGYVVARRQATVSSDITGRLREILVEEGARVEEGQVLARLDDVRALIDLDLARARAESADASAEVIAATLAEARLTLGRTESLSKTNVAAEAALTSAQAQVKSLAAQLRRARADASAARFQVASQEDLVDRHLVRAPFTGVVIGKNAQAGEIVSPTSAGGGFTRTGVYTLVDMASLEIEVDVNEGSIDRVKPGQRVEAILDAYPDWRIGARVEAIIPTADRSRATIQVRVAFDEIDPRILPDMAARVSFLEGSGR